MRAKFRVSTIQKDEKQGTATISAHPVYGGGDASDENKEYWKWTPAGSLVLSTLNLSAAEKFEEGQEFYMDLTPIPKV